MKRPTSSVTLLSAATATGAGSKHTPWSEKLSMQAVGRTTAGAGACVVRIEVTDMETPTIDAHWIPAIDITLTLSTTDSTDGQQFDARWRNIRARVTSISGTGASVDVYMGG